MRGCGNFQSVLVDGAIAEHQNVDVDQPRPPAFLAHPLKLSLGVEAEVEQAARRAGRCEISAAAFRKSGWSVLPQGGVR